MVHNARLTNGGSLLAMRYSAWDWRVEHEAVEESLVCVINVHFNVFNWFGIVLRWWSQSQHKHMSKAGLARVTHTHTRACACSLAAVTSYTCPPERSAPPLALTHMLFGSKLGIDRVEKPISSLGIIQN